jgi:hypothetical protein
MDSVSFDKLVRIISEDASRRGVLRSAFAAAVAGIGVTALLSPEDVEAKSCQKKCKQKAKKHDWSKKKKQACLKKCNKQGQSNPGQGKANGALCDTSGECAAPNICALPLGDSGGDKRCCGASGAPCGGDNIDLDDLPPICCQGFVCSTDGQGTSTPGTCQPAP